MMSLASPDGETSEMTENAEPAVAPGAGWRETQAESLAAMTPAERAVYDLAAAEAERRLERAARHHRRRMRTRA
jgi:uncharacterized protein YkwD